MDNIQTQISESSNDIIKKSILGGLGKELMMGFATSAINSTQDTVKLFKKSR